MPFNNIPHGAADALVSAAIKANPSSQRMRQRPCRFGPLPPLISGHQEEDKDSTAVVFEDWTRVVDSGQGLQSKP
jgi:hypothetical protein